MYIKIVTKDIVLRDRSNVVLATIACELQLARLKKIKFY